MNQRQPNSTLVHLVPGEEPAKVELTPTELELVNGGGSLDEAAGDLFLKALKS